MLSTLRRIAAIVVLALLALVMGMATASAHVAVSSPGAAQGGYAVITFRVPSESATATTTAVTIQVPADTPLSSARIEPIPGWTHVTTMQTLAKPVSIAGRDVTQAIDTITWTANDGVGLRSDEFQEFTISAGPLPESDQIVFKALQSYSDGTRVDWIEQAAPGSTTEPDHPAPTLALAKASADSTDTDGDGDDTEPTVSVTSTDDGDGSSALGVSALIVAIVALLGAGAAIVLVARRRTV